MSEFRDLSEGAQAELVARKLIDVVGAAADAGADMNTILNAFGVTYLAIGRGHRFGLVKLKAMLDTLATTLPPEGADVEEYTPEGTEPS